MLNVVGSIARGDKHMGRRSTLHPVRKFIAAHAASFMFAGKFAAEISGALVRAYRFPENPKIMKLNWFIGLTSDLVEDSNFQARPY